MEQSRSSDFIVITQNGTVMEDGKTTNEDNKNHWNAHIQKYWIAALFFGCFLVYSTRTTVSICAVKMGEEFGWDKKLSGVVMSAFFVGYIVTQVIGGMLADRYGGERVLFWSAMLWAFSTFCIPMVGDIFNLPFTLGIIVLRAVSGAAQGVHFPALVSLLSRRIGSDKRNSAFAIAASGTAVGNIFSGFAGSLLLESSGWRSVFYLIGGLSICWLMILRMLIMRVEPIKKVSIAVQNRNTSSVPWLVLVKSGAFWALLFAGTCESLVYTNLLSWLPTYFHDQFPDTKGWLFNMLPWVASFFLQNVGGNISDRMLANGSSTTRVRKTFVAFAGFVPAILNLVLNRVNSFEIALMLMTIIVGCMGTNSSGLAMNPQDLCPDHAGSMFGLMNTMAALSGAVGVYITGYVLDTTKEWASVFHMSSIASFLGAGVFLVFGTGERLS